MASTIEQVVERLKAGQHREAADLIEKSLKENPQELLKHRIDVANWLVLGANWRLITELLVPGTNFFLESGWLESILRQYPVDKAGGPLPRYTYPAIEFLEQRVRPEFRVFEYGASWSTLWWAKRVASVTGVLHDPKFMLHLQPQLPANASVSLQTAKKGYVGALEAAGGEFDVIAIAGEHSNDCVRAAVKQVKPAGALVFDVADRPLHSEGVKFLSESGWLRVDFFGLVPTHAYKFCTSVFFRDTVWLTRAPLPAEQRGSLGPSCHQAMKQ